MTAARKPTKPRAKKVDKADGLHADRASAERWQRGAEIDTVPLQHRGHRVQRVLPGLLRLEKSGRISGAEVAVALRWKELG